MKKLFAILVFLSMLLAACGQTQAPAGSIAPTPAGTNKNGSTNTAEVPNVNPAEPAQPKADSTPSRALDKVKVGTLGVFGDSAIYLAAERGYFKEQGIEVDIQKFGAATELITALGTGQIDAGDGPANAALYNMLGSKINIKLVAPNVTSEKGRDGGALVVGKRLSEEIKKPADLKGRKIGVAAVKGSASQIYIEKLLAPEGLTLKDIEFVGLTFADMLPALSNGAIDAAILPEPHLSNGITQGIFFQFRGNGEMFPGQEANLFMLSPDFAKKTDIANRLTTARLKGVRDYNDAFFKNKGRDEVVSILTKNTSVKEAAAYKNINFAAMHPDGKLNPASLLEEVEWYTKNGIVTNPVDIQAAVDTSYSEYALKTLGPYDK
ncbi:ABC transporter substrate-binding protein [Paenibacillus puerhi]|uniref:ABC transporter substrate-binding protein n=1 Tax=Paenibacillus puerhi TaxID=2692622 RepID=UPI00135B42BA|nr:ABC transporter substrate-binding protein [Paenibacillus puerhi]